jgi:hypothetical protein
VAGECTFSPKNSQATSFSFVTFLLAMKKKSKPRPARGQKNIKNFYSEFIRTTMII